MQALDQNISKIESDRTASWQQFETLKVHFPKELFSSSTTDIARGAGPVIAGKCVYRRVCQWVCHQRTRLVGSCMSIGAVGVWSDTTIATGSGNTHKVVPVSHCFRCKQI
jgi:hypothetical protein